MNCLSAKNSAELIEFINTTKEYENKTQFIIDILKDAEGQATEAFSFVPVRDKSGAMISPFDKWGYRFIPSLSGAHRTQQCNNFKDPGVQHYSGVLFESIRDELNDIFNSLPPPVASIKHSDYGITNSPSNIRNIYTTPRAPVSMASYNNNTSGCFSGECSVLMFDNSLKLVKDIRVGDNVMLPDTTCATVTHVTKVKCQNNKVNLTQIGDLLITPWHPILMNNVWTFPNSVGFIESHTHEYVYNFVLNVGHIVTVNGIKCVTLGHGFTDNDVITHEYFGTNKVINDLDKLPTNFEGSIIIDNITRDAVSGLICKYY